MKKECDKVEEDESTPHPPTSPLIRRPVAASQYELSPTSRKKRCLILADGCCLIKIEKLQNSIFGSVQLFAQGRCSCDNQIQVDIHDRSKHVVIKRYRKDLMGEGISKQGCMVKENPLRELQIQQELTRKAKGKGNILPLLACLETFDRLYAVFPYIPRECHTFMTQSTFLPLPLIQRMFRYMVQSLVFCHTYGGVCHRDVSLENFLLNDSQIPILIDFGLAVYFNKSIDGELDYFIPHDGQVGKLSYVSVSHGPTK